MYKTTELYDLSHSLAGPYLSAFEYPWQALSGIRDLILELGKSLPAGYRELFSIKSYGNTVGTVYERVEEP